MQRSSNIDEPDFGYLHDDNIIADGAKVQHSDYCRPRVEVELAFVLGKKLMADFPTGDGFLGLGTF